MSSSADIELRLRDSASPQLRAMGAELARARQEEEANQRQLQELQRELEAMGMSAQDAARRAQELQDQLRHVNANAAEAADGFGKVGGSAGKLGGVLSLVSPELGAAAQSMGDFGDLGEVAAEAAGAMGLSTSALLPILGGLALVLGVAALAYQEYAARIEAAEKEQERLQQRTEMLIAEENALASAVLKGAYLRGEISDEERARMEAIDSANELFLSHKQKVVEELQAEAAALREAEEAQAHHNEAMKGAQQNAVAAAYAGQQVVAATADQTDEIDAHKAKMAELAAELGNVVARENQLAGVLAENAGLEGSKGGGSAKPDTTAATLAAEAAKIEAARQQLLDIIASGDPTAAENRRYEKQVASIQGLLTLTGDQEAAQLALNVALKQHEEKIGAIQAAQEKQAAEAMKQATDARQADAEAWAEKQRQLQAEIALKQQAQAEKVSSVTSGIGAVSSGISGLSAIGPIGAMIAAIIGAVTSIVPEEGQEGLIDGIHNTMMEFFGDLGELGPVLGSAMVRSIQEGIPALTSAIPEFISGILEALPDLLGGALAAIPLIAGQFVEWILVGIPKIVMTFIGVLFDADTWIGIGQQIWDGFKEGFGLGGVFKKERQEDGQSLLDRLTKGSHDSGLGRVPEKGLYLLHAGERVLTEQQAKGGGGFGKTVVVNIQGAISDDIETLGRRLKAVLDPQFGRGQSLTYGGV